jgi:hypothetical protein
MNEVKRERNGEEKSKNGMKRKGRRIRAAERGRRARGNCTIEDKLGQPPTGRNRTGQGQDRAAAYRTIYE